MATGAGRAKLMVVLGLGSNISFRGDRLGYLRRAIELLKSPGASFWFKIRAISPIYESDALLPEGAPSHWNQPFLNLCVLAETNLDPVELLKRLKKIEIELGRKSRDRWAPREIDIDLLAFDALVLKNVEANLIVPHPGLMDRPFAIFPLADILPDWENPAAQLKCTASEFVLEWRKKSRGNIPFSTRRSSLVLSELVGTLNVTPDSFSDGGKYGSFEAAQKQAQNLVSQGIQILDVGAESTRPGAKSILPALEWERLEPIVQYLNRRFSPGIVTETDSETLPFTLSVDTRNAEVAVQAISAGANWINDVSGFQNQAMLEAVVATNVDLVMMHSLTVPADKSVTMSVESDPIFEIQRWAENNIERLVRAGIGRERIIFDPGLGFGKTIEQSWQILRGIQRFHELGVRILIGHSRKSFLSSLTAFPPEERDIETAALSVHLAKNGINFLRVHHAGVNSRALKAWAQVDGVSRLKG